MANVTWQEVKKDGTTIVEEIHTVVVHRFRLDNVDDPVLHAAGPIHSWETSEQGQFVMKHSIRQPEWKRQLDMQSYSYEFVIVAELEKKKLSEFYLRFKV